MDKSKGNYKGIFFVALSALFFSLNSVFAKIAMQNSNYSGIVMAFGRFIVGFVIFLAYVVFKKKNLKPNNMKYIILRAIFNALTIIFFFISVQFTTITNANMLNMTYPVFVFLMAPYMNNEKVKKIYYSFLILTMIGYYLIVFPDFNSINKGDVAGLMAGLMAAFAVSFLREARKQDESYLIMFYLMLIGSIITFIMVVSNLEIPTPMVAFYIFFSALMGVLGQLFITIGYRYVDSATGALVASSRIIFGVILGVSLFSEMLSLRIIVGGILIMISLVGVSGILYKYLHNAEKSL
ncbi:DMT family transporter [Marinisporobacter balticus]|nr:DMT family transporter [Marinisporobacter balticus]